MGGGGVRREVMWQWQCQGRRERDDCERERERNAIDENCNVEASDW